MKYPGQRLEPLSMSLTLAVDQGEVEGAVPTNTSGPQVLEEKGERSPKNHLSEHFWRPAGCWRVQGSWQCELQLGSLVFPPGAQRCQRWAWPSWPDWDPWRDRWQGKHSTPGANSSWGWQFGGWWGPKSCCSDVCWVSLRLPGHTLGSRTCASSVPSAPGFCFTSETPTIFV